jgi:hypothetical protein
LKDEIKLLYQLTPAQMQEVDRLESRFYGENHVAGWVKSMEWQRSYPWMSCFVEIQGKIVAFLDLMPVRWEFYDKLLQGKSDTDQLDDCDIIDLNHASPGQYPLLLLTIIVSEEYRNQGLLHLMFQDRINYYKKLQSNGFEFPVVGTENFTPEGCSFSQKRGWNLIIDKSPNHHIYEVDWAAFQRMWL